MYRAITRAIPFCQACILYLCGAYCSPTAWHTPAAPGSSSAPAWESARSTPLHSATAKQSNKSHSCKEHLLPAPFCAVIPLVKLFIGHRWAHEGTSSTFILMSAVTSNSYFEPKHSQLCTEIKKTFLLILGNKIFCFTMKTWFLRDSVHPQS